MPKPQTSSNPIPVPPELVEPSVDVRPSPATGEITAVGNASDRVARHGFDREDGLQAERATQATEQGLRNHGDR